MILSIRIRMSEDVRHSKLDSLILFTERNILHVDHATGNYHMVLFRKLGDPQAPSSCPPPANIYALLIAITILTSVVNTLLKKRDVCEVLCVSLNVPPLNECEVLRNRCVCVCFCAIWPTILSSANISQLLRSAFRVKSLFVFTISAYHPHQSYLLMW